MPFPLVHSVVYALVDTYRRTLFPSVCRCGLVGRFIRIPTLRCCATPERPHALPARDIASVREDACATAVLFHTRLPLVVRRRHLPG